MKDKEFLTWIWSRLQFVHNERVEVDYMRKLYSIIQATPPEQETPNIALYSWEEKK